MSDGLWAAAGDIAFNAFFFFTLLFVLLYATISPWWRTPMGRNIMTLMGALAAVGIYSIYANWLSRKADPERYDAAVQAAREVYYPHGFWQIRFIIFATLALAVLWRIVILVKAQVLTRQSRKKEQDHDLRS